MLYALYIVKYLFVCVTLNRRNAIFMKHKNELFNYSKNNLALKKNNFNPTSIIVTADARIGMVKICDSEDCVRIGE